MTEPPRLRLILERAQSGYRLRDAATDEFARTPGELKLVFGVAGLFVAGYVLFQRQEVRA